MGSNLLIKWIGTDTLQICSGDQILVTIDIRERVQEAIEKGVAEQLAKRMASTHVELAASKTPLRGSTPTPLPLPSIGRGGSVTTTIPDLIGSLYPNCRKVSLLKDEWPDIEAEVEKAVSRAIAEYGYSVTKSGKSDFLLAIDPATSVDVNKLQESFSDLPPDANVTIALKSLK